MLPKAVQNLIDEFSRFPGIGPKTAARLVFYLLTKPKDDIASLGRAVLGLRENLKFCRHCFNIAEAEVCPICSDERRDRHLLAVVEEPLDVIALERAGGFTGLYHVLGGAISPIEGIGPEQLRINQLLDRLHGDGISEVVLATDPDFEGEATAAYIRDKMRSAAINIKTTRIARGLPVGGDLEYADEVTIKRSLEGRREY
ncbi:MAG: recombination mediator RecR [Patescibacteria group bacterium]